MQTRLLLAGLLFFVCVSPQVSAGPVKPKPCCKAGADTIFPHDYQEIAKPRAGKSLSPQQARQLNQVIDAKLRDVGISVSSSPVSQAVSANWAALAREIDRVHAISIDREASKSEKLIAARGLELFFLLVPNLSATFRSAEEAQSARDAYWRHIDVSRAVSEVGSTKAFDGFLAKYRGSLERGHTADEAVALASDGMLTVDALLASRAAFAMLPSHKPADLRQSTVFVQVVDGALSLHTNYSATPNSGSTKMSPPLSVATRIDSSPLALSLHRIFSQFIPGQKTDSVKFEHARKLLAGEVIVLIDESVFDKDGIPLVDLSGIANMRVVDSNHRERPAIVPEMMATSTPPPSLIGRIKGCCFYIRPPHLARRASAFLASKPIESTQLRFASLFVDTATEVEIMRSNRVRKSRIMGDAQHIRTDNDIAKIFEKSKGKALVLISHVEGSDYVIRKNDNSEQFRIPIATVRRIAKEQGVQLIDIGCETVSAIAQPSFEFGVINKYRSVDAVKALEKAMGSSTNLENFLANLASENLKIVIEPMYMNRQTHQASIYSRVLHAGRSLWVKVARISFWNF